MGIFKNLKRRFGMAKRFKGGIKEEVVEEIAKRVAEEDIPESKMRKKEFLISKNLHDRPNSHMAIKAWEDYQDSFYDI